MSDAADRRKSGLSEGQKALFEAAMAQRSEIYRLRGEFVSEMAGIDAWLDAIIVLYFLPVGERATAPERDAVFRRREELASRLLRRMPFSQRLGAVRELVEAMGLVEQLGPTLSEIGRLNEVRNSFAHSSVALPLRTVGVDQLTRELREGKQPDWYAVGRGRGSQSTTETRIDVEELWKAIEDLSRLGTDPFRIQIAVMALATGDDPAAAVHRFDVTPGIPLDELKWPDDEPNPDPS